MLKDTSDLTLVYQVRRDFTQPMAPCDGCYYHNKCDRLCAVNGPTQCIVPRLDDSAYDYYIYVEKS